MKQHSTRVAATYFGISILWIAASDTTLAHLFPETFPIISVYKGWLFVLLTTALIKHWLGREEARRDVVEAELRDMAIHDPLTGLLNHGAFLGHLTNSIARARRANIRTALLFIDLDGFKGVNDTYGHSAGDDLLRSAVERMRTILRAADTAARLGGDEFVILVDPEIGDGAAILAQRLLDAFRQPFTIRGQSLSVTLSMGIARFPEHGDAADALIQAADQAMYRAKAGGKNDFVLADCAAA